ncbi:MAG: Type II secretion system protein E [Candidatus Collierbacteria bacterium GW2011_GWB1_44_6]|uniref:Type II secretion system protein E n=1 Tax=Candidatus Collierbacteria bacterium GW2011_GWB1_44_6 TaxID=1618384 RepID=A0A0G1JP60_9BACT|nr:MAG: Type II secretion system protein E [Candidatus Collierbacteria bacterium GW2011_GWB1_44_6]
MDYQEKALLDFLLSSGRLDPGKVDTLKVEAMTSGKSLTDLLLSKRIITEEDLAQSRAKVLNIPYFSEPKITVSPELLALVSVDLARNYQVVPLELDKGAGVLSLIMEKPEDLSIVDFFQKRTGYKIKSYLTSKSNLDSLISNIYSQSLSGEISGVLKRGKEASDDTGVRLVTSDTISQIIKEPKIVEIVRKVLEHAIRLRASDIHIEPEENITRVRYRIDGILEEKLTLDKDYHAALVSRIKILAGMKIDERRIPQDGRFNFTSEFGEVDLRISSLPTVNGEKIVMRLLKKSGRVPTLSELGIRAKALATLEEAIRIPHGIILSTGPTGSGKTTTLYSLLTMINTPRVNIVTLEDPVEYQMSGVNQVQVNPQAGLTFASGLRSFLRQDPNIIMVGEIRDEETAQLAIQASLTGHLVFSTVHTSSAAGALPRLLDMGAEPFLLASSMTAVIGQRVLRTICENCKQPYVPEAAVVQDIQNILGKLLDGWIKSNQQKAEIAKKNGVPFMLYKGAGCDKCGDTGYLGRIGIFEVLRVSEKIARHILERADATTIEKIAMEDGMIIMKQDGYLKVLDGISTLEEVIRVAQV